MGAGIKQQNKVANADPQAGSNLVAPDTNSLMPNATVLSTDPGQNFTFSVDPTIKLDVSPSSTVTQLQSTPQPSTSPENTKTAIEPQLPSGSDFRQFELSPVMTFSISDALPASLFEKADVWKYDGSVDFSFSKDVSFDVSFKDYTWDVAKDFKFEGVRDMGTVISNTLGEQGQNLDQNFFESINQSYGYLFDTQSMSTTTGTPVKERPLEKSKEELAQNAVDAVLRGEPLFHETSGENRGKVYKSRIENTLKLLQEGKLDLNDPEVKKMVVAIARQLYAEAALEPNQVPSFFEMLKMGEFGRNVTPEQFEKIVNDLTPDQMKRLLDGSIATLKERLISPPKAWIMNKQGVITDDELDTLRGRQGATPRQVVEIMNKVWTRDEMLQAETKFYRQTGYHTSFYEDTYGYTNYEAGIRAMEARADSSTNNSAYVSTLSSSSTNLKEDDATYNRFLRSYLTGSVEDVLIAGAELEREEENKENKEKKEQESRASWFTNSIDRTLALAGQPDKVVDTTLKKYVSTSEIEENSPTTPVLLSTAINLPPKNDTDDTIV